MVWVNGFYPIRPSIYYHHHATSKHRPLTEHLSTVRPRKLSICPLSICPWFIEVQQSDNSVDQAIWPLLWEQIPRVHNFTWDCDNIAYKLKLSLQCLRSGHSSVRPLHKDLCHTCQSEEVSSWSDGRGSFDDKKEEQTMDKVPIKSPK
jgi:hypothetical protein